MIYVYDIEVYPNLFVAVFKNSKNKEYETFTMFNDDDSEIEKLKEFLQQGHYFVGFNNVSYDAQILEHILRYKKKLTNFLLKKESDIIINEIWGKYPEWKFITKQIDLYRIWHYNNNARRTSLKWLEFMFRKKSIKDLPYEHDKTIVSQNQVDNVVKYCKYDVDVTEEFFEKSKDRIKHRVKIGKDLKKSVINKSDSSIGELLLLTRLSEGLQIPISDLKKMRTQREKIVIKDIIFDYYKNTPITNKVKEEYFSNIVLESKIHPDTGNYIFNLKGVKDYTYMWDDMEVVYGMGGIHGCVPKGIYESDDKYIIKSCDVTSEYPNIIISNGLYPEHLGSKFVEIYKNKIVDERKKYPKSTHYMENQMYKLGANAAYGKTNSQYSGLYDPKVSVTITVNGQLSKTMLGEFIQQLVPNCRFLMMNTDGLEVMIPRDKEKEYMKACNYWEKITGLSLEHDNYEKLVIDNVNNYIGFYDTGDVKRKGRFYVMDDYDKYQEYHKNSSASIIPEAIFNYFAEDIPVEQTIMKENNIYKFCYGSKKTRSFEHAILIPNKDRTVKVKKDKSRVFRYYASNSKKSGSLYKLWNDGRLTALQKNVTVLSAQSLYRKKPSTINRQWYINEANKILNEILNEEE